MSSKQINFYITPEDIFDINNFLLESECVFIKENTLETKSIFIDSLATKEPLFKVGLSRSEFANKVQYKYLEAKNYYYLDVLRSYVIDFDLGGFYPYSNKELHRGRFYYVFEYYGDDGNVVCKNAEFIEWADSMFKNLKSQFLRKAPEFTGDFFSERCIEWARRNQAKPMGGGIKLVID